jgi:hypothetical protein
MGLESHHIAYNVSDKHEAIVIDDFYFKGLWFINAWYFSWSWWTQVKDLMPAQA